MEQSDEVTDLNGPLNDNEHQNHNEIPESGSRPGREDIMIEKSWNIDIHMAANQYDHNSQQSNLNEDLCSACGKRVYPVERFPVNGRLYHKNCFRCTKCNRSLGVDFSLNNGLPYCKPHFLEIFKLAGRYDQPINENQSEVVSGEPYEDESDAPPPDQTKKLLAKFRQLESSGNGVQFPVASVAGRTPMRRQTSNDWKESAFKQQPLQEEIPEEVQEKPKTDDVVRSDRQDCYILEDEMPPAEITANLAAKWKAMESKSAMAPTPTTSQLMQKKARETSGVNSNIRMMQTQISNGQNAPVSPTSTSINRSSSHGDEDEVDESVDERPRGDIIRNEIGEMRDEELPQAGTTRSLLARFQTS